ncbi:MAG: DUF2950 domain-containing protein [Edaphobacter sp.]
MLSVSLIVFGLPACLMAQAAKGQKTFAKSSEAVQALVAASRAGDEAQLLAVLGPDGKDLIDSGDPVADKKSIEGFAKMYDRKHALTVTAPGYKTLVVGANDWPMPIPLVRDGSSWYWDSAQGRDEIVNRRIGENELGAIAVCEGYYNAQKEYAAKSHDGLPAKLYAQKFASDPGKQNGLYWPVGAGKPQSPLGPAVAAAAAEGYGGDGPQPYHGYIYKRLNAQGPNASGGARSYVVNGKQSGGFALIAYPAKYGSGGIMTFLVNQDGVIYQKDLGDDTEKAVAGITSFNPDPSWSEIE